MPNWCSNYLEISGNKEVIQKIHKEIKGGKEYPKLFSLFYPIPEELNDAIVTHLPSKTDDKISELVKKYGAEDWYYWSINNWGCKWDARDIHIEESNDVFLHLCFNTPWSPPIDFYTKLANEYKVEITATYTEESVAFCGRFQSSVDDGEVVINHDSYDTGHLQKEVLSLYAEQNKDKQVTAGDFYNELHSIYFKSYPEICEYYDSEEMFGEFWLEDRLEDKEFCKQYGIINETTT